MPKVLDTFEFPHGGRKGLDYDFGQFMDGKIYQLTQQDDFPDVAADTFLGSLSRYANSLGMRVNKHVSEDKKTVTIRVRPKQKKESANDSKTQAAPAKAAAK